MVHGLGVWPNARSTLVGGHPFRFPFPGCAISSAASVGAVLGLSGVALLAGCLRGEAQVATIRALPIARLDAEAPDITSLRRSALVALISVGKDQVTTRGADPIAGLAVLHVADRRGQALAGKAAHVARGSPGEDQVAAHGTNPVTRLSVPSAGPWIRSLHIDPLAIDLVALIIVQDQLGSIFFLVSHEAVALGLALVVHAHFELCDGTEC
mmetsp:Transcript_40751/g.103756  ORF Transcript_40751/g.103756 Transcript_40751/m.103756 type:complete len:211 (+) Transcript_40751:232-864(+)